MRSITRSPAVLPILLAAVVLGAAGATPDEPAGTEPFDLALDFYVNPDHVGIYEALDEGYFEEAGLDVQPQVPSDPSAPIKQVAAGRVDLAISYEPEVMLARDQGLDVVAVGALVNGPLTSLISLPAGGIELARRPGRTRPWSLPASPTRPPTWRRSSPMPASTPRASTWSTSGFNLMPPLIAGRADAMFGGFSNVEGVDLASGGSTRTCSPSTSWAYRPTTSSSWSRTPIASRRTRIRSVPSCPASSGVPTAAESDPAAATDALLAEGDALDPELTLAQVEATLPRLVPPGEAPYGHMDPAAWERFSRYLAGNDLIDEAQPADELLTNDLLGGPTR